MPARKIQDEQEAIRLLESDMTYAEIINFYREKYGIDTTLGLWSRFRARRGIPRRITRDPKLIPWEVKLEHRHLYPIIQLRAEARRRAGNELSPEDNARLDRWLDRMKEDGTVLHYEPDTDDGWFYVPRREGVDLDIIREPEADRLGRGLADV